MRLTGLLMLCLVTCGMACAQKAKDEPQVEGREENGCSGLHHPGDHLRCYVTFAGKTEFTNVSLSFNLPENPDPKARGKYINFVLRDSRKIDERTYEVSGELPECYSGTYVLAAISAVAGEKGYRLYSNGYQFQSGQKVEFVNDTPEPPKELPMEKQAMPAMVTPSSIRSMPDEKELEREAAERKGRVGVPAVREGKKNSCGGIHKPGDMMECLVSFSGEPKFHSVILNFGLRTQMRGDQAGMCNGVLLQKSERVDDRTFRVSGEVPWCASGKYQVNEVVATEMRWSAFNGERVDGEIVMYLRNEDPETFPDVKSVGEKGPKEE